MVNVQEKRRTQSTSRDKRERKRKKKKKKKKKKKRKKKKEMVPKTFPLFRPWHFPSLFLFFFLAPGHCLLPCTPTPPCATLFDSPVAFDAHTCTNCSHEMRKNKTSCPTQPESIQIHHDSYAVRFPPLVLSRYHTTKTSHPTYPEAMLTQVTISPGSTI